MITFFRNLLNILNRFRMAMLLNICGLAVAFTAFYFIAVQLRHDLRFGTDDPESERIFRLDLTSEKEIMAVQFRPLAEMFFRSSPNIEAGTLVSTASPGGITFAVENDESGHRNFRELLAKADAAIGTVFTFNMTEGTIDALARPGEIVIPQSLADKLFNGSPAVGQQLITSNVSYFVGGVYRDFPANSLLRNIIYARLPPDERLHDWNLGIYHAYFKLDRASSAPVVTDNFLASPDFSVARQALAWMGEISLRMVPIRDIHFLTDAQYDFTPKTSRATLVVLFTLALAILAIAAINFTNFSIALVPLRIKGINTRKVLGSSEGTIIRTLLLEAMFIAFVAFLFSILLITLFSDTFIFRLLTADATLPVNGDILMMSGAVALCVGAAAGLYPARYSVSFAPAMALKGNQALSPRGRKLRGALISTQFFASFVLIICALFMYLQNDFMQTDEPGYDRENLLVTEIPNSLLSSREAYEARLRTLPGVESAAFLDFLLSGTDQYMQMTREIKGAKATFAFLPVVSSSFLDVIGLPIQEGRNFRPEDENSPAGLIMINQTAAQRYELKPGDRLNDNEIVAVIPDIKFASLRKEVDPMLFYLWGKEEPRPLPSSYAYIKLKAGTDLSVAAAGITHISEEFDSLFTFDVRPLDRVVDNLYTDERSFNLLIILFALIAVILSVSGVFGLVVYECEYRRKEIALRKVLGSSLREILLLFNSSYVRILALCFPVAALVAHYSTSEWLKNFAFQTPMYLWVYIASFISVLLVTVMTVTFQCRSVALSNPVESLRRE